MTSDFPASSFILKTPEQRLAQAPQPMQVSSLTLIIADYDLTLIGLYISYNIADKNQPFSLKKKQPLPFALDPGHLHRFMNFGHHHLFDSHFRFIGHHLLHFICVGGFGVVHHIVSHFFLAITLGYVMAIDIPHVGAR